MAKEIDIESIIEYCSDNEKKIRKQHKILKEFHFLHPWVLEKRLEKVKKLSGKVISFEEAVEFKELYLVKTLNKIYNQIVNVNPKLLLDKPTYIAYYKLEEGLYERQVGNKLSLGEEDENGKLVTGSDLIVEVIEIDIDKFLDHYYSSLN